MSRRAVQYHDGNHITSQRGSSTTSQRPLGSLNPQSGDSSSLPGSSVGRSSPFQLEARDTQVRRRRVPAVTTPGLSATVSYVESTSDIESTEISERPSKRMKAKSLTQPGRGIRKIVDLYHDLPDLLDKAKKHANMLSSDVRGRRDSDEAELSGLTEEEIEEERKDRKRCYTAVQLPNSLIPGFQERADAAEDINLFCAPLQSGANDARSDDTSRIKLAIANWLNDLYPPNTRNHTVLLSTQGKEDRGYSNDITGRLLCPIDYDWDDLDVRAKLRDAAPGYDFSGSFFLRCLYEDEEGDPKRPHAGFLKGPLLLRVFCYIFTSPSSAQKQKSASRVSNSRRRDVATTLRLNSRVTPRSIAYTATQLIFSLNNSRDWKTEYAGFYYPAFYNFIVDFFENAGSETSKRKKNRLLQWWNKEIFPVTATKGSGSAPHDVMKSSLKRLQEAVEMSDSDDDDCVE